jgi:hypothetical protein
MSSSSPLVWVMLLNSFTVEADKADVANFRNEVKKNKDDGGAAILNPFESSQLLAYQNKAAFD